MKKQKKNRLLTIHQFYDKLDKLINWLEKETGETLDIQISTRRKR